MRGLLLVFLLNFTSFYVSSTDYEKEITFAFNDEWWPYSVGADLDNHGILPALMQEIIEKRMGYRLKSYGLPWARAEDLVARGELDALVTTPMARRLKHHHRAINTVYSLELHAVTLANGEGEKLLVENPICNLPRLVGCHILNGKLQEDFYNKHGVEFKTVRNIESCLNTIAAGRTDFVVLDAAVALGMFGKLPKTSPELKLLPHVYERTDMTLLLSKQSELGAEFLNDFDNTLLEMKNDGSYYALLERLRGGGGRQ